MMCEFIQRDKYMVRKALFDNIKTLVKSEYEEVYRILRRNNEPLTENSNGIFFDVMDISDDTYTEMEKYMNFCLRNRKNHEERLHEIQTLRPLNISNRHSAGQSPAEIADKAVEIDKLSDATKAT